MSAQGRFTIFSQSRGSPKKAKSINWVVIVQFHNVKEGMHVRIWAFSLNAALKPQSKIVPKCLLNFLHFLSALDKQDIGRECQRCKVRNLFIGSKRLDMEIDQVNCFVDCSCFRFEAEGHLA